MIEDEGHEFDWSAGIVGADAWESLGLVVFDAYLSGASGRPGVRDGLGTESVLEHLRVDLHGLVHADIVSRN